MEYHKLIHDKLPEIMRARGERFSTHVADDAEYWRKLKEKLRQEVNEFIVRGDFGELASVLELVHALCAAKGMTFEELEAIRRRKAEAKGGYGQRIILDEKD